MGKTFATIALSRAISRFLVRSHKERDHQLLESCEGYCIDRRCRARNLTDRQDRKSLGEARGKVSVLTPCLHFSRSMRTISRDCERCEQPDVKTKSQQKRGARVNSASSFEFGLGGLD